MTIDYNFASEKLSRIFLAEATDVWPIDLDKSQSADDYIFLLAKSGWTRKDIYKLVCDIDNKYAEQGPPECSDSVSNYITRLIGHVPRENILRLPGEKGDINEHASYVSSMNWM